jgi:hypothetical protein
MAIHEAFAIGRTKRVIGLKNRGRGIKEFSVGNVITLLKYKEKRIGLQREKTSILQRSLETFLPEFFENGGPSGF